MTETIIDTALSAAAGTVVKDLEPAAVTAFEDLKTFVHGQADRLRTALPALEQAALDHVRAISGAVLTEYQTVLNRIDAHLTGATPNIPAATMAPSVSVDPTPASSASAPPVTDSSSGSVPPPSSEPAPSSTTSTTITAPEAPTAPTTPGV